MEDNLFNALTPQEQEELLNRDFKRACAVHFIKKYKDDFLNHYKICIGISMDDTFNVTDFINRNNLKILDEI